LAAACTGRALAAPPEADEDAARSAANALAGLDVAPGLEATLFAAEPMLLSPTNIDVDQYGRVWVCEVVNYRHRNGSRPEGDRILIFRDTDGDGRADEKKVFYQGREIDTAMGICVLGNRVIVSVSPNVYVFTDVDGDDKADKKELLFSNTGTAQHDHSAHAFLFGPDGRLYWNFGNEGKAVHDAAGKPVVDLFGRTVVDNGRPYREGMAFRCNLDGGDFEVLGYNFRNNYELAVDSFGTIWQSDNDDDGNRGVRINYVMEYGNFGYRDEMTGAGWRTERIGMEEEIPLRHWHLNDPGVVPNLLQTGAGSPTGIAVYEGDLLPEQYRGALIHCDAGPNVVRAYRTKPQGAGYVAESFNILHGARDQWFRPSDVCVAPDGSLIVADWYDPGVGGHRMGDIERGRLFRVAPPKSPYLAPVFDFKVPADAMRGLKNPNLAVRYLAFNALKNSDEAIPELASAYESDPNPRFRARALWLLGILEGPESPHLHVALADADPDIRITALRLARRLKRDVIPVVRRLDDDESPQVRRECAIALRQSDSPEVPALWAKLAAQHDGRDRWYLEALGIAAAGRWDACLEAWLKIAGDDWKTPAGRDLIWRSRAERTCEYLAELLGDRSTPDAEVPRYLRAFDFQNSPSKQAVLARLAFESPDLETERGVLIAREALLRLDGARQFTRPDQRRVVSRVLDQTRGTMNYLRLIEKFAVADRNAELLALAQQQPDQEIGVRAIRLLLARKETSGLEQALEQQDPALAQQTIQALGSSQVPAALPLLWSVVNGAERPLEYRREAIRGVARFKNGANRLIELAESEKLDAALREATAAALHQVPWDDVRGRAAKIFPPPPARNSQPLKPLAELAKMRGDAVRGRLLFHTTGKCHTCHVVDRLGKDVGPNLSEIGDKLSRQACVESIVYPSAGISHNYETYVAVLESGNVVTGILTSRTPESVTLKGSDAIEHTIPLAEVEEMRRQEVSLMPADLQKDLTEDELIDIVEYLTTLRKRNKPGNQ